MKIKKLLHSIFFSSALLGFLSFSSVANATACDKAVGQFASVQGEVDTQQKRGAKWITADLNTALCEGSTIRVGEQSRATVSLINDAVLRLDQNTTMKLTNITPKEEERSFLDMVKGAFHSFSRKPKLLTVNSAYLNGSIEGTEYVFRVENGRAELTVFEGTVIAANDHGSVPVGMGKSVTANKGEAPKPRVLVNPRDEVKWGLYYPSILVFGDKTDSAVAKAARLLEVGRVDEAQKALSSSNSGLAYALKAVINVALNNIDQALADGRKAVDMSPSAASSIALSYAQQASLDLEGARATMQSATDVHPDNALAVSRLSELTLILGDRKASLELAEKAASMDSNLGHTQVVLGFAALASYDHEQASAAFNKAMALDSANPLSHLGLGLAIINAGNLTEGRKNIEAAVAMDSNDAILRAYLGKSYFEEKRDKLATEQYDIAMMLDPNDPTSYLYSGILKQTNNDPIGALTDIEKSIELNDNRAVYRSRLLLDQDRAARGTSLARVYKDLGFDGQAIKEASKSLQYDPTNASAHRFLSDSYRGVRRTEIARVSELLQAQMLQDVNLNPIQPSISGTNLNMVTAGGPAQAGFNEFNALFQKNEIKGDVSLVAGSHGTAGGEFAATAIANNFSISAGVLTYDSEGWRALNNLEQDIQNVFVQYGINEKFNIQGEYYHSESDEEDLAFEFLPTTSFIANNKVLEQDYGRIGLRFNPSLNSTILMSHIQGDVTERVVESDIFGEVTSLAIEDSEQTELQYIRKGMSYSLVMGAVTADTDTFLDYLTFSPFFPLVFTLADDELTTTEHDKAYVYLSSSFGDSFSYLLGLTYDDYQENYTDTFMMAYKLDIDELSPKLGLQWNFNDSFAARLAAFQTVKPLMANNRNLEPTQIMGFNQFYDDTNGAESKRYGLGFDWKITPNLSSSLELTRREISYPYFDNGFLTLRAAGYYFEEAEEDFHQLTLEWKASDRVSVVGAVSYDHFEALQDSGAAYLSNGGDVLPQKVETVSLPITLNYFSPRGYFASVKATYVDQEVTRNQAMTAKGFGSDDFTIVDVAVGYKLPKYGAKVSLGVSNLFDEEFLYQDNSYREFSSDAVTGPYFPETMVMGQVSLSF